jgi:hypothetical protein
MVSMLAKPQAPARKRGVPPARKIVSLQQAAARRKLVAIVDALGHNVAAGLLQVDRSQLSRVIKGTENASADLQRRAVETDYVLSRLLQVMYPDEIAEWLTSPEPLLGDAIPANVLRLHGPDRVVRAINGIAAGVYS